VIKNFMLGLGLVGLTLLGPATSARADQILAFGQIGNARTVTATNPLTGGTTITATNVPITVTALDGITSTPFTAAFSLNIHSITPAIVFGTVFASQEFSGSFSIMNGATNVLSGTFTDAVFGGVGGDSLTLSVSNASPGQFANFTSDVIPHLASPRSISLAFSAVNPGVAFVLSPTGTAIRAFQASVAGNFSATATPEPAAIATVLSGLPVLAFGLYRRHRSKLS